MNTTIKHEYYPNGRIERETSHNDQGQLHGREREWHDNGWLKSEVPYRCGQLHGTEKEWYGNGQSRLEVSYRDDVRYGVTRMWDEYGKLIHENYYLHGRRVTHEEYEATLRSKT